MFVAAIMPLIFLYALRLEPLEISNGNTKNEISILKSSKIVFIVNDFNFCANYKKHKVR
jgi:hypothetical protein